MNNFAIIGVAGFVAPKHLQAIKNTGGNLIAAYDIADSAGVLDSYFPNCEFFTNVNDFELFIQNNSIHFLVVCSPNYLHIEHCAIGLKNGMDVICEKPLCLDSASLEQLMSLEKASGRKIYTILQLRLHEEVIQIKNSLQPNQFYEGSLAYFTPRGNWYYKSWKGIEEKSGGIATNIGVHFFDMLCWFFGEPQKIILKNKNNTEAEGNIIFGNANIHWHLSIDRNLPATRKITLNGKEHFFTEGFNHLHTRCYDAILDGRGFGTGELAFSTRIIEKIRVI
jgi:UDP-N-acetyl-2-amino-2-deoxyglucuronate dehydrogenase